MNYNKLMRIGRFNITWSRKTIEERGLHGLSEEDFGIYRSCLSGPYAADNLLNLFMSIPEVFAPIDTIAGAVCTAKWELRKIANDEVVYANKDWNKLTAAPNWKQDWNKFIYNAVVYKYVTGNRYFYAYVPETMTIRMANVVGLWALPPQYTEIKVKTERVNYLMAIDASDIVDYYQFNAGRDRLDIQPQYVHHDAFIDVEMDSYDVLKGTSPLATCEKPMGNLIAVYSARRTILVKRGALGFIVSKKGDASGLQALTKTEKEDLQKDYQGSYGLTGSKSPVAITSLPIDYIKVGATIADLQPWQETDKSADAIYGALRVPEDLKPGSKGTAYENQRVARRALYTNVAIPEAIQIAAILTKLLKLTDDGFYIFPSFEHVEDLQENKKEKSEVDWKNNETARVRFQHGIITLNDWVVESGYEKVKGVSLYDKRVYEMDEAELAIVKSIISIKSNSNTDGKQSEGDKQGK